MSLIARLSFTTPLVKNVPTKYFFNNLKDNIHVIMSWSQTECNNIIFHCQRELKYHKEAVTVISNSPNVIRIVKLLFSLTLIFSVLCFMLSHCSSELVRNLVLWHVTITSDIHNLPERLTVWRWVSLPS